MPNRQRHDVGACARGDVADLVGTLGGTAEHEPVARQRGDLVLAVAAEQFVGALA